MVLEHNPVLGRCRDAMPPLNSGDCLLAEVHRHAADYCINPEYVVSHLIAYPQRGKILDQDGFSVVVLGEAFAISALVFADDPDVLQQVLDAMEVQALVEGNWVTRKPLQPEDYDSLSNLREYDFSDCGTTVKRFAKQLAQSEKLYLLAHAALSKGGGPSAPVPAPESHIAGMPRDPERADPERFPIGDDQRLYLEMYEHEMKRAEATLASLRPEGCQDKVLPYYWTSIYTQYSPALGDTQLRLHVDSEFLGTGDIVVTEPFHVYFAAASSPYVHPRDGNRKVVMSIYAAGDMDLRVEGWASISYDDPDGGATLHRTHLALSEPYEAMINGLPVKRWPAAGKFPFRKQYYDEEAQDDVSTLVAAASDLNPIAIRGGDLACRSEFTLVAGDGSFVSSSEILEMPQVLTFALMGDSFSAGQGAPMLNSTLPNTPWFRGMDDSCTCHRSRNSAIYRAVNRFIKSAELACDYCFVACDGAKLADVTEDAQRDGEEEGDGYLMQEDSQVELVSSWLSDSGYSHLSCALFSIGGNDARFAKVIASALFGDGVSTELRQEVDAGFEMLEADDDGYTVLAEILRNELSVGDVIICGYPDLVHDENGDICASDCPIPDGPLNTIKQDEVEYGATVLTRLTETVRWAADNFAGWHYADIFAATQNHGVCVCVNAYYVSWMQATAMNYFTSVCSCGIGSIPFIGASCSFHPNERGYGAMMDPIVAQLNTLFD